MRIRFDDSIISHLKWTRPATQPVMGGAALRALALGMMTALVPLGGMGCSDTPIEPTATPVIVPTTVPPTPSPTPTLPPELTATPSATPSDTPTPTPGVVTPTLPAITPTATVVPTPPPTPTLYPEFPALELSSGSVDFGSVLIGSAAASTLTVYNVGTAPLSFELSFADGSALAFAYDNGDQPDEVLPEEQYSIALTFTPTDLGAATATLQLLTNDPDNVFVQVPLSGNGVIPTPDDLDGDGSPTGEDCNDADPNTYPGAPERCDGVDNDCDGIDEDDELTLLFVDNDGDGHGDPNAPYTPPSITCEIPPGYALIADDCDDVDASSFPGGTETCDGRDNNCDGTNDEGVTSTFYTDADSDGHGDATAPVQACQENAGVVASSDDCNDGDSTIYPTAPERCDEIDNDCDDQIDEDLVLTVYYADKDLDGYGDTEDPIMACGVSTGIVEFDGDCDDTVSTIYPGAPEVCDGIDNDCQGDIDEDDATLFYSDLDGDGYGDANTPELTCQPESYQVADATDCDDTDASIKPNAFETCDARDNNCNGQIDEGVTSVFYADADNDGYGNAQSSAIGCSAPSGYVGDSTDCNDNDSTQNPGVTEQCNGRDDNCNEVIDEGATSTYYVDADGDGHGDANRPVQACGASAGIVSAGDDCNDTDAGNYPGNTESCDLKDNDCDAQIDEDVKTTYYQDLDGDGFGNPAKSTAACTAPADYVLDNTDCNDKNQDVYPGAAELCNSRDDNCNSQVDENVTTAVYKDADGDSYGDPAQKLDTCTAPTGYVSRSGDCNDQNAAINPGATELCNATDDNCDGQADEGVKLTFYQDLDSDSYGNPAKTQQACTAPTGYVSRAGDCNDTNSAVYPGAVETCDALDNNCNGSVDDGVGVTWYQDADNDAYGNPAVTLVSCAQPSGYVTTKSDCNDSNASIYPNAPESCNGLDDDCDTQVDEGVKTTYYQDLDSDTYGNSNVTIQACTKPTGYASVGGDCKDTNDAIYPGSTEIGNGVDDDCDGQVDEGVFGASCKTIKSANPSAASGLYTIDPDGNGKGNAAFEVYCDMVTDGGGWIVFQRRQNGSVDFFRGWADYANGFGTQTGEFWLGNDKIAYITSTVASTLRVDMKRYTGATYYAYYSTFGIGDGSTNYKLNVTGYSGTAPDCCGGGSGMYYHSGMVFSTRDRNNSSCANAYKGAWWYNGCHYNNLNGYYYGGPHSSYADGVNWYGVAGYYESLIFSEMKMR